MKTILSLTLCAMLAACAGDLPKDCPPVPTPKSQVIDQTCDTFTLVKPRKGDVFTDATAKEILANNDKYTAHCATKAQ